MRLFLFSFLLLLSILGIDFVVVVAATSPPTDSQIQSTVHRRMSSSGGEGHRRSMSSGDNANERLEGKRKQVFEDVLEVSNALLFDYSALLTDGKAL